MELKDLKWPLTEDDMMHLEIISPKNEEELIDFIRNLVKYENNDYGTAARSLTLAAEAAFNYIAHMFDVSGFQAGYAQMDFMIRMRNIKSRLKVLNYDNLLYPQYLDDFYITPEQCIKENASWLKKQAKEKLKEATEWTNEKVIEHWKYLAKMEV
jgi:hypothetical protein